MDLNEVNLIGRLTADPKVTETAGGTIVTRFCVATGEKWTDNNGNPQERTEFNNIVMFNGRGKNVAQFVRKGSKVFVKGSLKTSTYEKEGQKHYNTEIVARDVIFLDPKKDVADAGSDE